MISTFGCVNGLILSGARVSFAMARDGHFFAAFARLNRAAVPGNALWLQAAWASLLVLTGTYSQLLKYVVSADLLLYVLLVLAVPVLRRRRPDLPRPFRAPGYPWLQLGYAARGLVLIVLLLIGESRSGPGRDTRSSPRACRCTSCGGRREGVVKPRPRRPSRRRDARRVPGPVRRGGQSRRRRARRARARRTGASRTRSRRRARSWWSMTRSHRARARRRGDRALSARSRPAADDERARLLRLPVVYDGEDLAELAQRAGLPARRARTAARGRPIPGRLRRLRAGLRVSVRASRGARVASPADARGRACRRAALRSAAPGPASIRRPRREDGGCIGRTSAVLFDAAADPPSLLAPGDRVEFEAVTAALRLARPRPPPRPLRRVAPRSGSSRRASSLRSRARRGTAWALPECRREARWILAVSRSANAEVGNPPDAPALEITFAGPELEALEDAVRVRRAAGSAPASASGSDESSAERGSTSRSPGGFVDPRRRRRAAAPARGRRRPVRGLRRARRRGSPSPPTAPHRALRRDSAPRRPRSGGRRVRGRSRFGASSRARGA